MQQETRSPLQQTIEAHTQNRHLKLDLPTHPHTHIKTGVQQEARSPQQTIALRYTKEMNHILVSLISPSLLPPPTTTTSSPPTTTTHPVLLRRYIYKHSSSFNKRHCLSRQLYSRDLDILHPHFINTHIPAIPPPYGVASQ